MPTMGLLQRLKDRFTATSREPESTASDKQLDDIYSVSYEPVAGDFPVYPPWSPRDIINDMEKYKSIISARKFCAPQGESGDNALYSVYRMYDYLMLDDFMNFRTELQQFWRTREWKICEIPDPKDTDPARYAVLACVVLDMVISFNDRIKLGLTRDQPPMLSGEERRKFQEVPLESRPWEKAPTWTDSVPSLEETLRIPAENSTLADEKSERADPVFLKKNVLVIRPPIFFT